MFDENILTPPSSNPQRATLLRQTFPTHSGKSRPLTKILQNARVLCEPWDLQRRLFHNQNNLFALQTHTQKISALLSWDSIHGKVPLQGDLYKDQFSCHTTSLTNIVNMSSVFKETSGKHESMINVHN